MHVVFLLMAVRRITQTTPKWLHINPVSSFKHSKSTQLANIGQSGVNCNPICVHPSVRPSARLLVCSSLISFPTPLVYDRPICLSVRLSLILSRCPFVPSSVCLSMRLHLFLPHACTQRIVSHCIMYNKRIYMYNVVFTDGSMDRFTQGPQTVPDSGL